MWFNDRVIEASPENVYFYTSKIIGFELGFSKKKIFLLLYESMQNVKRKYWVNVSFV